MTDLLSAVGLGLPASATDGPVAPSPAVLLMASLDFVRRDLEQMSDDQLIVDPQQDTADTLIVEEPSNDSGPAPSPQRRNLNLSRRLLWYPVT